MSRAEGPNCSFVVPWYGREIPGGAEAEARRTAQNLARAGVGVQVLTTCLSGLGSDWDQDHYPPGVEEEEGVLVRRFASARRDGALFNELNARICAGGALSRREEYQFFRNMVFSPGLMEHIAAHPEQGPFFFIPYLFTTAAWGPLIHPSRSVIIPCLHDEGYARLASVKRAFESARALVFHVPAELELARRLYRLERSEPLILGEGVDSDWQGDPQRFRRKFGLEGPFVLYAGRKDAGKNVPLLARYFAEFVSRGLGPPGLKLVMIGNLPAPVPPGAEDVICDLGFVERQDKYDAYAAASVLVQPSLMESFSLVIMESWLAGTPVMVHAGCAVTREHVLACGGGLFFDDYPHFAEGLARLLADRELSAALGRAGRRYVLENYSWPVVTRRYLKLIERLDREEVPPPRPRPPDFHLPPGSRPASRSAPAAGRAPAVHQVLADFSYGDAIGNEVLAMQKALRSWGFASDIFVVHVHPRLQGRCRDVEEYQAQARPQDLIIFHFSVGHPLAERLLSFTGRKVMRYHNITPAHYLERAYPQAAERCRLGRRQLKQLAPAMELGIGVSDFNCRELEEAGCPATVSLPIVLDLEQLETPPDPAVLARFRRGGPNLLHVGRIVPNKCIEDLVKVHYWLGRLCPGARLFIVGGGGDDPYGLALRSLVSRLQVAGVHFPGHVSDPEMMAYYRLAHLYLCQSEHEGFCVPLVESMHFGLPIVAHAAAAIPDTLGPAGILLPHKDHLLTAEVIARVLQDQELGRRLGEMSRRRLEHFRPQRVTARFRRLLSERLGLESGP